MTEDLLLYVAVGFAAQLVDGALGMAFGITTATLLTSLGLPPATASAAIHTAEVVTTGLSGGAHWKVGNVDKALLLRLAVPGVIGGCLGAYILTELPVPFVRLAVSTYLMAMGGVILWRAIKGRRPAGDPPKRVPLLGLAGGFLDAIGGGGWGPVVTTTLVGAGTRPRTAIGTANMAEFFVTIAIAATFVLTIGQGPWEVIAGLIGGGALAAPFAAIATRRIPDRPLMVLVGGLITLLSLRNFAILLPL